MMDNPSRITPIGRAIVQSTANRVSLKLTITPMTNAGIADIRSIFGKRFMTQHTPPARQFQIVAKLLLAIRPAGPQAKRQAEAGRIDRHGIISAMGKITKWVILPILLAGMLATVFSIATPAPRPPPLPFDVSPYVATKRVKFFTPQTNGSLKNRLVSSYFSWQEDRQFRHPRPENWSFPATPVGNSSIMGSLNQCMGPSGRSYFMSPGVSAGIVQFGHTNTLDGAQWVAAVETALQSPATQTLDLKSHKMVTGGLVLIRFPEQRAVLVLTEPEAVEFRRTNSAGIETPLPREGRDENSP